MTCKSVILFLFLSCLFSTCKKDYDWDVVYKVNLVPKSSQTNYDTKVIYRVKDNVTQTEIIHTIKLPTSEFGDKEF